MSRSAVLFAVAGACVASAANGAIVLTVDITNPTAVVIASTGAAASASRSGFQERVRLDGILTAGGPNYGNSMSSSLAPAQIGGAYTGFARFGGGTSGALSRGAGQTQTFVEGLQAFSGSMTGDLSFLPFAPAGTIGDIYVIQNVNAAETGIIIGQYQIVPAPGAAAVLGLAGLVATRRRR